MLLNPNDYFTEEQAHNLDLSHERLKYNLERIRLARTPDEQKEAQQGLTAAQHEMSAYYCAYLTEARKQGKQAMDLDVVLALAKEG